MRIQSLSNDKTQYKQQFCAIGIFGHMNNAKLVTLSRHCEPLKLTGGVKKGEGDLIIINTPLNYEKESELFKSISELLKDYDNKIKIISESLAQKYSDRFVKKHPEGLKINFPIPSFQPKNIGGHCKISFDKF